MVRTLMLGALLAGLAQAAAPAAPVDSASGASTPAQDLLSPAGLGQADDESKPDDEKKDDKKKDDKKKDDKKKDEKANKITVWILDAAGKG